MYNNICLCLLLFSSCNFLNINILACYVFVFVFIAVNQKSKQNKQKMTQSVATHINVNFQPTYYLIVSFLFFFLGLYFFLKFYTYVCFLPCTSDMPTLSFTTRMQCVIPDAEIIIPSAENQRFQRLSPLSRSGSEYSCACLAFCQEFKPHHFYHPSFKKRRRLKQN